MDVMDMTYPDESFDVVIDKGTMDALMVRIFPVLLMSVPNRIL